MDKIRGVNLGNWLVLEKWMHPALFEGTSAEDEDELCRQLPREELVKRLTAHRDSYITKEDFSYIHSCGLNTVRIPVPHFIFGDDPVYYEPYMPCIEYLDKAFDWAETGLSILIDLHTAPESQNGFDNGGICRVCKWAQDPEKVDRVLKVLEMLALRYGSRPSLWGIQLLNEPISESLWQMIRGKYLPHNPERGRQALPLSRWRCCTIFIREGIIS
ncbi:MAG: glycoside hydrolase family 5 protein [Eisenbergiella sp.]